MSFAVPPGEPFTLTNLPDLRLTRRELRGAVERGLVPRVLRAAQVWIEIDGVATFRLHFAYRLRRICVEYDGADFHELTADQRVARPLLTLLLAPDA